ncbi:hypothetical protein R3W88_001211 [Solanum pinnatisectum]|uniref:Uncharacterized protein n=1 Tax=Solanum pinnatisectum TaxID=50273 RepID=A0AAV9MHU4_9SOLN|nr:hypothetical protein R3W88_001211 [Solanum pinnatisectum]
MTLKTAIPRGKIASKLFDELSHSSFNFGESKKSTDSSNSTKVNSLMVNTTNMDEKFTMMEQTIEALRTEINHASVKFDHKKDSISKVLRHVVSPKVEEVEVSALKKTTNTSKVDDFSNEESSDTWTLITLKRQKHQGTSKLRLSKLDTKSSTNQLQQCESIKSNTKSKYINTSSPKVRWTIH